MTATLHRQSTSREHRSRILMRYPTPRERSRHLLFVVIPTVALYYQFAVQGTVSPQILETYGVTFKTYVVIAVCAGIAGAFAALASGLAGRVGRANVVIGGLLLVALVTLFVIPNATDKVWFFAAITLVQVVEGVVLVVTPALTRDFSPQVSRGKAMAVWTLGPIGGSLLASEVTTHTIEHLGAWQDVFIIAGTVLLAVTVLAFFGLRELSPELRAQVIVSELDRAILEARAKGIDFDADELRRPWHTAVAARVVTAAFSLPVFLVIYVVSTFFFTLFYTLVFGLTSAQANGLNTWLQGSEVLSLLVFGALSDRLGVRKPFLVLAAVGAGVMTLVLRHLALDGSASYATMRVVVVLLGVAIGCAYAPALAAFTELVEQRNPTAVIEGLAVQGWITRIVASLSLLALPIIITSVTTLTHDGPAVRAAAARSGPALAIVNRDPQLFARLANYPDPTKAPPSLVGQALARFSLSQLATVQAARADLRILQTEGPRVRAAQAEQGSQWADYLWIAFIGQLLMIPLTFFLGGRWSPRRAAEDKARHDEQVEQGGLVTAASA